MKITGTTQLLGLIGDPVSQARTPAMANELLERRNQLGVHVLMPMHVASEQLEQFLLGIRAMQNFGGAVVTMPHKTRMAALIDELTAESALVGAVNVIHRRSDGKLVGTLLDGEGFVVGLQAAGHAIAGKACVLVGAGGAASAIAFALAKHGCRSLCLLNRTSSKASSLAKRIGELFPEVQLAVTLPSHSTFDIAINGTSLGMRAGDPLPMDEDLIDRTTLVAECVVSPEITALLEVAKRRGRQTHTGVHMLAAQIELMLAFMGSE
jgi:shikimate dehydrogenase